MLEIYAIAGGDWLRGNLNAIAAFMGTSTWSTIEKMCIAISVLIVGKRAARTVLTGMCYSVGSATRQGSSSPTRFIGQSAMTSRT